MMRKEDLKVRLCKKLKTFNQNNHPIKIKNIQLISIDSKKKTNLDNSFSSHH